MWCWMEAVTINKCTFPNTWAWGVTRTTFGTVLTPVRGGDGKREIEGTLPTRAGSWNSYSQVDGESFRHVIYCLIPTPVGGACIICVPVFHYRLGKAWGPWRLPVELCQIPEGRSLGLLVSLVLQYTRPGWRGFMGSRSTGITEFLLPRGPASNGFRCEG